MKSRGAPFAIVSVLLFSACTQFFDLPAKITLDLSAWSDGAPKTTLPTPAAPAYSSIEIGISGPGMEAISATFPPGTVKATVMVPVGPSRTFSLAAETSPGSSPILRRVASATVDIVPGDNEVTLRSSFETKLVVPDMYRNAVKQYDDMSGANPASITQSSPRDIDFDAYGRVFIGGFGAMDSLFCAPYIDSGVTPTMLSTSAAGPETTYALAMDRERSVLYHATSSSASPPVLYAMTLNATDSLIDQAVTLPPLVATTNNTTGLAVNDSGQLYLLGTYNTNPAILKIDAKTPATTTLLVARTFGSIPTLTGLTPYDVLVKDGVVYLTAYEASGTNGLVLALTEQLDELGQRTDIPIPMRFLAVTNRKIFVTDDVDSATAATDRVVAFDAIDDPTLETFTDGTFTFFLSC